MRRCGLGLCIDGPNAAGNRAHRLVAVVRKASLRRIGRHAAPGNVEEAGETRSSSAGSALLLRLASAVRHLGMLVGGLRVAMSLHRFLTALGVFPLGMALGRRPVALRRIFLVFCRFGMGFPRYPILRCISLNRRRTLQLALSFQFRAFACGRCLTKGRRQFAQVREHIEQLRVWVTWFAGVQVRLPHWATRRGVRFEGWNVAYDCSARNKV